MVKVVVLKKAAMPMVNLLKQDNYCEKRLSHLPHPVVRFARVPWKMPRRNAVV